jgi:hypothetical protein
VNVDVELFESVVAVRGPRSSIFLFDELDLAARVVPGKSFVGIVPFRLRHNRNSDLHCLCVAHRTVTGHHLYHPGFPKECFAHGGPSLESLSVGLPSLRPC